MKLPFINPKKHPLFNCGNPDCPICAKAYSYYRIKKEIPKENFSTDAVAPFVGRYNYPNINLGILAPPKEQDDSWLYDAPRHWSAQEYNIPRIIEFRSSLINSRISSNVRQRDKLLNINQEIAMASKPVDIEINLKEKPRFNINLDNYMPPTGPKAILKKANITSNPKIHAKVDKVYSDTDLKASDAITYLYKNDFDENLLSKILSVATIGLKFKRKLVPTRWSITATDDILGKKLIEDIKENNQINYSAFFGGYLGNYYLILFFPEVWGYELFEMQTSNIEYYMTDHESYEGRKNYAQNTAGGYYSVRLAVLEKLKKLKKQASVLALRFITGDYTIPLGVFVTREAARNALRRKPLEFSDKSLMMLYAKKLVKKRFNVKIENLLNKSIILKQLNTQKKLTSF